MKLKELREAQGMTQAQVARAAHVSRGAVCMWESGARQPGTASLLVLADLFGVSMDALFGRNPPDRSEGDTR